MARTITTYRSGEPRVHTIDDRNEMRLSEAIAKVALHGYTDSVIRRDVGDPLVLVLSDYWPKGEEVATFARTRGKYPGQTIGTARRPEN